MKYIYLLESKIILNDTFLNEIESAKKSIDNVIDNINKTGELKTYSIDAYLKIPEKDYTNKQTLYIKLNGSCSKKASAHLGYMSNRKYVNEKTCLSNVFLHIGPEDISSCSDIYFDSDFIRNLVYPDKQLYNSYSIVEKEHEKSLCKLLKEDLIYIKNVVEKQSYLFKFEKETKQYLRAMKKTLAEVMRKNSDFLCLEEIRNKGIKGFWLENDPSRTARQYENIKNFRLSDY